MRDPRDDKSSHSISFSKMLIFSLLMAIFSFFLVFLLYSLLNIKAPVDRTKQHRELKFVLEGLCRIAKENLSPLKKQIENFFRFCRKFGIGRKIGLVGNSF